VLQRYCVSLGRPVRKGFVEAPPGKGVIFFRKTFADVEEPLQGIDQYFIIDKSKLYEI
jgi:hypothetical protein